MTTRQREARELFEAGHGRSAIAAMMRITVRAVRYLLRRAGISCPVGRPAKPKLQRISYAATGLF